LNYYLSHEKYSERSKNLAINFRDILEHEDANKIFGVQ